MGHCHPNFSREMGDAYFFLFHYETENFFCEKSVSKKSRLKTRLFENEIEKIIPDWENLILFNSQTESFNN